MAFFSWFDRKSRARETIYRIPSDWTSNDISNILSQVTLKNTGTVIDTTVVQGQTRAYTECSIIQGIAEKKSSYMANGRVYLRDNTTGQEITSGIIYQQLRQLMKSPNPLQTWEELEASIVTYMIVYGYAPLYRVYPLNRKAGIPQALWVLNPDTITYELSGKQYDQVNIQGIVNWFEFSNYAGKTQRITGQDLNNLWILNARSINVNKNDILTSLSPLVSLKDSINLFQVGLNVYATLLRQSMLGIISNRSKDGGGYIPLDDETNDQLQAKFRTSYGITEGKNNYIVSNRDLFFQSLLTNIGNLNIPDGLKIAVGEICNKLSFNIELLSNKDVTYENKRPAEVQQYQDDIIPLADHIYKSISAFIMPVTGTELPRNYEIAKDFSALYILQENEKEKADVLAVNINTYSKMFNDGLINLNTYLEALEQPQVEDGDKYVSDLKEVPAAVKLGVGGTQALQAVLVDPNLTDQQKINMMVYIFGIPMEQATIIMS